MPEFADVIRDCWQHEPSARPSFEQVVERISGIIAKYFPHVADYDTAAIRAYKEAQNERNAMDRARMEEREAKERHRKEEGDKQLKQSLQQSLGDQPQPPPQQPQQQPKKKTKTKKQRNAAKKASTDDTTTWTDDEDDDEEEDTSGEGTEGTEGTDATDATLAGDDDDAEEEEEEERKGSGILVEWEKRGKGKQENLSKLMEVFVSRRANNDAGAGGNGGGNGSARRPFPRPLHSSVSLSMLPVPAKLSMLRYWLVTYGPAVETENSHRQIFC